MTGENMTDARLRELTSWTNELLDQLLDDKQGNVELEPVSGDASFRRYFRARVGGDTYIAVDAPPEHEDNQTFVHLSNLLLASGISAPKVYSVDYGKGFMLLVDLGDDLYLPALLRYQRNDDMASSEVLYSQAIDALVLIQSGLDKSLLPAYTVEKLLEEMQLFPVWFCESFLSFKFDEADTALSNSTFLWLAEQISGQHQVAVHRDYHSRNLMALDTSKFGAGCGPGVIDFQDAVSGSYTYDLVSLLRDCYISWPKQQVEDWACLYLVKAQATGLLAGYTEVQLIRDMNLAGLQRNLKVIGIFARLSIRDNKSQYLADIPLVVNYFLDISAQFEEMAEFRAWFITEVLPLAKAKLQLET
jgi:aminoglycoside/choline kinase family phosphotransferase